MKMFTVITGEKTPRVLRVKARSIQHATQSLHAAGIPYQGISEDQEGE